MGVVIQTLNGNRWECVLELRLCRIPVVRSSCRRRAFELFKFVASVTTRSTWVAGISKSAAFAGASMSDELLPPILPSILNCDVYTSPVIYVSLVICWKPRFALVFAESFRSLNNR